MGEYPKGCMLLTLILVILALIFRDEIKTFLESTYIYEQILKWINSVPFFKLFN